MLRNVRRRRVENTKEEPEDKRPPPVRSFHPTKVPYFDPSRPPPVREECVREPAPQYHRPLTERERIRAPETFPRSSKQIRDDGREEEMRAA